MQARLGAGTAHVRARFETPGSCGAAVSTRPLARTRPRLVSHRVVSHRIAAIVVVSSSPQTLTPPAATASPVCAQARSLALPSALGPDSAPATPTARPPATL